MAKFGIAPKVVQVVYVFKMVQMVGVVQEVQVVQVNQVIQVDQVVQVVQKSGYPTDVMYLDVTWMSSNSRSKWVGEPD